MPAHPSQRVAHLRTLVPKAMPGMVFETRVLQRAVCGPFGLQVSELDSVIPLAKDTTRSSQRDVDALVATVGLESTAQRVQIHI